MALRKPSDFFSKKSEENNLPVVESDDFLRDELSKVESLSEQVTQLQQELSQKVVKNDLESLVLSQINSMQENFEYLQNDFKKSNKKDIGEFENRVSELTKIVGNIVENELPKYKKQITNNEVRIGEKFDTFKEIVEENIIDIRQEIDSRVENIAFAIDENLEHFNNQLQETSSEVKRTTDTYNKLSKIVENKISKENEKLEEYSQVIEGLYKAFVELEESLQEETSSHFQVIKEKFQIISSDVNDRIDNINEEVESFKGKVCSEISNIKADVVISEKHNNDTEKTIQQFSEQLSKISKLDESIVEINKNINTIQNYYEGVSNQSAETKKNLEVVERYIQNHYQKLIELKEEVFAEIEKLPLGNVQENVRKLEKKLEYIEEVYKNIEPEVIVKEVIQEGLLNDPPKTKNSDPLTPLNQNFVTLDQLQEHYRLFINRIQQQLATLGGGETRLRYLDDIVGIATNASAYDGKFLQWNSSTNTAEFVTVTGVGSTGGIQDLNTTLGYGNTSLLGMSIGVVTASSYYGDGSTLSGIVTYLAAGTGINVSANTGYITISATGIGTTGVAPQLNSDWNAVTGVTSILNKPVIPAAQVNSDWDATTGISSILNKPIIVNQIIAGTGITISPSNGIGTITINAVGIGETQNLNSVLGYGNTSLLGMSIGVVTASSYYGDGSTLSGIVTYLAAGSNINLTANSGYITISATGVGTTGGVAQLNSDWNATTGITSILNKPIIPAEQVNSDWNATTGISSILNKPTIVNQIIAGTGITISPSNGIGTITISATGVGTSTVSGIGITFGCTPPIDPTTYPLWYDSCLGRGFVYYDDGNSSQWVDFSPSLGNPTVGVTSVVSITGVTTYYAATSNDDYIGVSANVPVLIDLPSTPTTGKKIIVKDEGNNISTYNITVRAGVGASVENDISVVMNINHQSFTYFYNGSNWFLI